MRYWLLSIHVCLLVAVIALVMALDLNLVATGVAFVVSAAPLAFALRGLHAGSSYTQQWLSIAMVFYVGLGLVETIASQAQSLGAVFVFLTSGIELCLLFAALRRARRASHESTE